MESSILEKLNVMKDWSMAAIMTGDEKVLVHTPNCNLLEDEIKFFVHALDDRDTTVGEGFFINNVHYEVHRFHTPLVYGRTGGPDDGEGIALCRFKPNKPAGSEEY